MPFNTTRCTLPKGSTRLRLSSATVTLTATSRQQTQIESETQIAEIDCSVYRLVARPQRYTATLQLRRSLLELLLSDLSAVLELRSHRQRLAPLRARAQLARRALLLPGPKAVSGAARRAHGTVNW